MAALNKRRFADSSFFSQAILRSIWAHSALAPLRELSSADSLIFPVNAHRSRTIGELTFLYRLASGPGHFSHHFQIFSRVSGRFSALASLRLGASFFSTDSFIFLCQCPSQPHDRRVNIFVPTRKRTRAYSSSLLLSTNSIRRRAAWRPISTP